MLIPGKSARLQHFCCPRAVQELQARQFTSIAVITSWDIERTIYDCERGAMLMIIGSDLSATARPFPNKMQKLTIAIDGPAGSGKSSLARRVASMLGYLYMDSGAMYRALALKALRRGVSVSDERALSAI